MNDKLPADEGKVRWKFLSIFSKPWDSLIC
jgi:hypothetical protein